MPKLLKPFLTPVSQAGLPIAWETLPYDGKETCLDIPPHTLARLYWLTEAISLRYHLLYSYRNSSEAYQGEFILTSPFLPHERIHSPPVFEYESSEEEAFRAFAQLDLYNISHRVPFQNRYGFSFDFFFENTRSLPTLAFSNRNYNDTMQHKATQTTPFLGRPFPGSIYTVFPEATASIQAFEIHIHPYHY